MTQSGHEDGTQGTDSGQGQGQQGTGDTGSQSGTGGTGGTQSGADGAQHNSGQSDGSQDTVSRADFDRMQAQLRAADQKREQAEKALKEINDKDLSELEKAKQDLQEQTEQVTKLTEENHRLKLGNAFLSANTITWQNGDVALDIAERQGFLEGVQADDGTVDAKKLSSALTKLSQEHAYLVKKDDSGEGGGDDSGKGGSSGQSGMGRGGKGASEKEREDELRKKFPALGRR